ncbi:hypothetical protein JXB12_02295 [candidate division KSB1 bacterium]|nr:hypothetical protein [candidate division KSB1 bacterium]
MQFHNLTEFLRLSAVLNYQLSTQKIIWENILSIIIGNATISSRERSVFLAVLEYLGDVYGQKKRRLGSLSILHPLRATALLVSAVKRPRLIDMVTELLHDNFEDFKPERMTIEKWINGQGKFNTFLKYFSTEEQDVLLERLKMLSRNSDETYYQYIGRMLDNVQNNPEIIRIKLADRLDNTLDMRIDLVDPLEKIDFFEQLFQLMFNTYYEGYKPDIPHPAPSSAFNGAQRMYQLFKNTVLMSLIRKKVSLRHDQPTQRIFQYLAHASMKEAQRNALHIFGYHERSVTKLRHLLIETMEYVLRGGIDAITSPREGEKLDGLFISHFNHPERAIRESMLADLYQDKPLMIEASLAFIVIFLRFINDPDYFIRGISETGVHPESTAL